MLSDRDYMRPGGQPHTGSWRWPHSAVVTLIFLTVLASALAGLLNLNADLAVQRHELVGVGWLRLVTSLFVHAGVMHLLMNMYGLYLFGRDTETLLGPRRFVILYLVSGLAGNLLFVAAYGGAALGASGCVFGVAAAAMLLTPNQRLMLLLPPVALRMRTMVLIYVALEVIFLLTQTDMGIAHLAHLGGFAAGYGYVHLVLWQRHGFAWPGWLGRRRGSGSPAGWSILDAPPRSTPPSPSRHEPPPLRREPPAGPAAPRREPRANPATALSDDEISREIDPILDKISQHGMSSLSRREREILDRARERLKGRT